MPFLFEFQCAIGIPDDFNSLKMCIFLRVFYMLTCYYIKLLPKNEEMKTKPERTFRSLLWPLHC